LFGIFRTLLAFAVICHHATESLVGAGMPAVYCFCLSGFLMTLLMSGPYAGRPGAFFLNRFLRLYPMYWATFGLLVLLAVTSGRIQLPGPGALVTQALYYVRYEDLNVVPQAWAVTSEIVCYLLIGLGLTSTPRLAALSFAAALAITLYVYFTTWGWIIDLYFPFIGALFPFAVGGLLAHLRFRLPRLSHRQNVAAIAVSGLAILVCILVGAYTFQHNHNRTLMHTLYLCLIPTSVMIIALYRLDAPWLKGADDAIGKLSYPMYLTHWLAIALAGMLVPALPTLLSATIITLIISIVFVVLIDEPVQRLRTWIKRDGARNPGSKRGLKSTGAASSRLLRVQPHFNPRVAQARKRRGRALWPEPLRTLAQDQKWRHAAKQGPTDHRHDQKPIQREGMHWQLMKSRHAPKQRRRRRPPLGIFQ
jgi:peptidoglycan/LPS O-acetylase OafA/YrhL